MSSPAGNDSTTATSGFDGQTPAIIANSILGVGLGAGGANVIMQLSRLPVGHGVAKSTVDSGRVDRHPLKRLRTTSAFLVIVLWGTDAERRAMRAEINRSHRTVQSGPDDPVAYDAFDPELQRWVAACLYMGIEDIVRLAHPEVSEKVIAEEVYPWGQLFGTTLQMSADMWPADRAAFEEYWQDGLAQIQMDELTRGYLQGIADLSFLVAPLGRFGRPLQPLLRPIGRFMTLGALPQPFRDELRLPWTDKDQRRFDALSSAIARVAVRLPRPLREFPLNLYLADTRRRIRRGLPIV